ncbi:MAG: Tfx family DNA-binding protein [Candidatus Thermoplasmatota archaeon]|nr:Tfx family DNA-binding protein [Candidatus Thermoplasmatota archaeon]
MRDHFLTKRQIEVLLLEKDGLSHLEIAKRLGRTVQDIYVIDKRIRENVKKAQNTLYLYEDTGGSIMLPFKGQSELIDILREIINESDRNGIKLKENIIGLLTILRQALKSDISKGRIKKNITIMIRHDGTIKIL